MIDCPKAEVRDLLPDFVNERLEPAMRAAVESHLATCPACRDEIGLLRAVSRALVGAPPMPVDRIVAALPRPIAPATARLGDGVSGRRIVTWRLAAAVALFAVGGGSLALAVRGPGPQHWIGDSTGNAGSAIQPGPASTRTVELATLTLGDRLSELSDADLEDLLTALEGFAALPSEEPAPVIHPLDTDGDS